MPTPSVIKQPDPPAAVTMASPPQPTVATDPPFQGRPRTRNYLVRVNASCPPDGAFNGTCKVYFNPETQTGDQFFYLSQPVKRVVDGKIVLSNEKPPTWFDVVDEYPLPAAPKPLARVPGAAPGASRTETVFQQTAH